MTIRELIAELQVLSPDALVVFRHHKDDDRIPDDYETVDCFEEDGEAFIDIHGGELDK